MEPAGQWNLQGSAACHQTDNKIATIVLQRMDTERQRLLAVCIVSLHCQRTPECFRDRFINTVSSLLLKNRIAILFHQIVWIGENDLPSVQASDVGLHNGEFFKNDRPNPVLSGCHLTRHWN